VVPTMPMELWIWQRELLCNKEMKPGAIGRRSITNRNGACRSIKQWHGKYQFKLFFLKIFAGRGDDEGESTKI
jgi:hypothetical protein